MRQLWTMTVSDLRQRVRDRSVVIFALVVPLALMYVFTLVFGGSGEVELEPITVAVAAPEGDELAGVLVGALDELGEPSDLGGMQVTVRDAAPAEVVGLVEGGQAGLGILVPDGFGRAVMAGEATTIQVIEGSGSGLEGSIVISVVDGVLEQLAAGSLAATAGAGLGLPSAELAAIARDATSAAPGLTLVQGQASSQQLGPAASLVAGQAGLFLLFTVGFGVLALVTDREQGTLDRLYSVPMRRGTVVAAKALVSFVLGVLATSVLLTVGGSFFGVGFGSPLAVGVLVVAVVTATTSLMFVIARLVRTSEQAGIAQSIVALVLGVAGGAFFPITAGGTLGWLLDLNPVAAFIRGLGITSGGGGVADLGVPLGYLLTFAVVVAGLSRVLPDRGAGR